MTPTIREATASDADAMLGLRLLMLEAMGTPPDRLADPSWRLTAHGWFIDRIPAAGVHVVVAEVEGLVVSGAVGEVTALIPGPGAPNGSVGLISNVATLSDFRGRGLAAAITDALLEWFREETDVTRVDLFATPGGADIYTPRGFSTRNFPAMSLPIPRTERD